jgi:hypothetical protein
MYREIALIRHHTGNVARRGGNTHQLKYFDLQNWGKYGCAKFAKPLHSPKRRRRRVVVASSYGVWMLKSRNGRPRVSAGEAGLGGVLDHEGVATKRWRYEAVNNFVVLKIFI